MNQGTQNSDSSTDHYFMKDATSCIRHFVKLINAADTAIAQDKGATGSIVNHGEKKMQWPKACLSKTSCFESGSRVTYAVRPTADEPLPDAYTPRGAILCTY